VSMAHRPIAAAAGAKYLLGICAAVARRSLAAGSGSEALVYVGIGAASASRPQVSALGGPLAIATGWRSVALPIDPRQAAIPIDPREAF
jgi:hypothetical protein